MSEKRFKNEGWVINDSQTYDEYHCDFLTGIDEVVDLLNELAEENEQLKKKLSLYEMNEDEVDKYLRTHPMPTTTNLEVIE